MTAAPATKSPITVIKAFDQELYARDFLESGSFIVRELRRYRTMEESFRRDPTEGEAHFEFPDQRTPCITFYPDAEPTVSQQPGMMHVQSSLGNAILVFCASLPDVNPEYLRGKFGKFLVEIGDLSQFNIDIQRGIEAAGYSLIARTEGVPVEYTKGDAVARDLSLRAGSRLSYIQKPRKFSKEQEFRFVSKLNLQTRPFDLPDYVRIKLGARISYAKLL